MAALASSTSGYIAEMGALQCRQRAPRMSQESTGMLSYQAIGASHLGQRDRRVPMAFFGSAPHARMQTFRKLPRMRPNAAATMSGTGPACRAATSIPTQDLEEKDAGRHRHVQRLRPFSKGDADMLRR